MNAALQKIKNFLKKILTLNDTPHGIALGFAVGLFLSVIPTFGLGMVAALALAPLIRANLISTYLGTLVVNPFTGVFFYSLDYFVGNLLLAGGGELEIPRRLSELFHLAGTIALPLYLGGFVLATVLSLAAYGLIYWGAKTYRRRSPR